MKYLPTRRLFFIHIPKCAGMSVRRALAVKGETSFAPMAADLALDESEAERVIERTRGFDHPRLGPIHPAHLPLALLKAEMPRTWEALVASQSVALIRAPRDRFISAVMQRLKEFKDAGAIRADDLLVCEEATRVRNWLESRGPFSDIEYIHFARQVDYVELDGQRVIEAIFPMDCTGALSDWIASQTGLRIEISLDHVRRQPKRWARIVQPAARFAGRRLMPAALKRALHPLWTGSGAFTDAVDSYGSVDLGAETERFVAKHYAADALLYEEAMRLTASHSRTSGA